MLCSAMLCYALRFATCCYEFLFFGAVLLCRFRAGTRSLPKCGKRLFFIVKGSLWECTFWLWGMWDVRCEMLRRNSQILPWDVGFEMWDFPSLLTSSLGMWDVKCEIFPALSHIPPPRVCEKSPWEFQISHPTSPGYVRRALENLKSHIPHPPGMWEESWGLSNLTSHVPLVYEKSPAEPTVSHPLGMCEESCGKLEIYADATLVVDLKPTRTPPLCKYMMRIPKDFLKIPTVFPWISKDSSGFPRISQRFP